MLAGLQPEQGCGEPLLARTAPTNGAKRHLFSGIFFPVWQDSNCLDLAQQSGGALLSG